MTNIKKDMESKVSLRLIKSLYVFMYVALFVVILISAYINRPRPANDEYNSKIICNNGKEYRAGDYNIDVTLASLEQQWQIDNPNGLNGKNPPSYLPSNFFTKTISDKDRAT